MIVGWVGRLFEAVGRARGDDAGRDLATVGRELQALERSRTQLPTSSR
jgi:DNA mismatch repair protein MutH